MRVNSIFVGVCNLPLPYNECTNFLNIKKAPYRIERQDLKANVFQARFYSAGGGVEENNEEVLAHTQTPAFSPTDELISDSKDFFLPPFIDLKEYDLSSNIVMKDQAAYEMFKIWESLIGYDATYLNFFGSNEYKEGIGYTDSDLFWLTNYSYNDQILYEGFKLLERNCGSYELACCVFFGC